MILFLFLTKVCARKHAQRLAMTARSFAATLGPRAHHQILFLAASVFCKPSQRRYNGPSLHFAPESEDPRESPSHPFTGHPPYGVCRARVTYRKCVAETQVAAAQSSRSVRARAMAGVREVMRPRVPGARAREGVAWLAVQRDLGEEEEEEEEDDDALPEPPASSPPFASLFSSLALVSFPRIALPSSLQQAVRMHARPGNSDT